MYSCYKKFLIFNHSDVSRHYTDPSGMNLKMYGSHYATIIFWLSSSQSRIISNERNLVIE